IEPMWDSQREVKIGTKKGNEIVQRVQSTYPHVFVQRAAFDGKKNLFAPTHYFPQQIFIVDWNQDPASDKKQRKVRVTMTHVNAIDFSILQQYIETKQNSDQYQNEVNLMINMLNVLVSATPKQKHGLLTTAKSIFVPNEKSNNRSIAPLELWRGYYQTVRPAFDKIVINVDVTIGIVLPADKLEHVSAAYLRVNNLQQLRRLRPDEFQRLRLFLRGVKVTVDIGSHRSKPPKVIKDVIQDVGASTFDRDGETVSIARHFNETHNIQIPPSTLGVKLGSAGIFPITHCRSVEQFYKNRATPDVVRAALEFTPTDPGARAREITKSFRHFDYANSGYLINAGINIDQTPQTIRGRLLKGPPIIFFGGTERRLDQRPGVWDVMRQRLARPATIQRWIVVDFARVETQGLQYFVNELLQAMRNLGISVSTPASIERRSIQASIDQARALARELRNLVSSHQPHMILAILPDPAEDQYRRIKRFGDIQHGVATQCVRWSRNLEKNVATRRVNQYQNNLILKINPKMGGTNFFAGAGIIRQLARTPFMIIGADVSHPGPGSHMPSIASLVASHDQEACRYAASVQCQSSRVEMIENFGAMFDELLRNFSEKNNKILPQSIYIFRDGVSEGEFLNVERLEKGAIDEVCKLRYPDKKPKIVYTVVGKRHHVRFFPSNPNQSGDPKGNGNFPSGLVIDNEIVHPRYCDFYLQSQPGLKGTSIPSHYTVLRNDVGIPLFAIQELAYALCHCYSRSTRSVKIPAPVYYADLVCRRAKFHFRDDVHNYSTASVSGSGDDTDVHLDFFRERFDSVNQNMRNRMYYV
ncbi:Protein argonaute 1C, partial [Leucoagaricus sp. SymC.cos]